MCRRISGVRAGLQAEMMYGDYQRSEDAQRRAALREQLVEYNRDDLDSLIGVAKRMRVVSLTAHDDAQPARVPARRH